MNALHPIWAMSVNMRAMMATSVSDGMFVRQSTSKMRLYRSGRIVPFSAATVGDCVRILRNALGKCLCGSTPLIAWALA